MTHPESFQQWRARIFEKNFGATVDSKHDESGCIGAEAYDKNGALIEEWKPKEAKHETSA